MERNRRSLHDKKQQSSIDNEVKQYTPSSIISKPFISPTKAEEEAIINENDGQPEDDKPYENLKFDFAVSEINSESDIKREIVDAEVVGLSFGTYLIAQDEMNMYIMDIHAANERINYERYLKALKERKFVKMQLLIPMTFEFSTKESLIIKDNLELIRNYGFDIDEFGVNTFRVTAHPNYIKEGIEEVSVKRILELITELHGEFDPVKFNESVAITLACKTSVKGNTRIELGTEEALLHDIFRCEFPYTCPHGRPTIIKYPRYELEKMFKRAGSDI